MGDVIKTSKQISKKFEFDFEIITNLCFFVQHSSAIDGHFHLSPIEKEDRSEERRVGKEC